MMMQSTEYGGQTKDSFVQSFISFLEHRTYMDITIICGNQTYHAHKTCLGALSPYLRDELNKNAAISQIVMDGVPGHIIKIILEYAYYGGSSVSSAEDCKMIRSVARFLRIQGLDILEISNSETDDIIPPPTFLTKKPRYPVAYVGLHPNPANPGPVQACNSISSSSSTDANNFRKMKKRKSSISGVTTNTDIYSKMKRVKTNNPMKRIYAPEVEQVYLREAATSKMTVDYLRQQLQIGNYFGNYATETPDTVPNVEPYIPNTDGIYPIPANYDIVSQPIQVNYDLNQGIAINESDVVTIDVIKEENIKKVDVFYRSPEGNLVPIYENMLKPGTSMDVQLFEQPKVETPERQSEFEQFVFNDNPEWMNISNFGIDNVQEANVEAYKGSEDTHPQQGFEDVNNEDFYSQNLNISYLPNELEMLNSILNEVTIPYSSKPEDVGEKSQLE